MPPIITPGPRAAETYLLTQLTTPPANLTHPTYVIVPSHSLRTHLLALIAREQGAKAALSVITLRRLAFEILRRAGGSVRDGSTLFPLLVRRHARERPELRRALGELEDGYASVAAAANDLLDAGLSAAHAEGLAEFLQSCWPGAVGTRATEVAEVALAAQRDLAAAGRVPRAGVFTAACDAFALAPTLLRARALWVYGYADVTGTQCDLLLALLRAFPGGIILDAPPNPAAPMLDDAPPRTVADGEAAPSANAGTGSDTGSDTGTDGTTGSNTGSGVVFLDRLRARVATLGGREECCAPAPPPRITLFRAPGPQAEVREVAERVAKLVDAGVPDESIGVVARDLTPFAHALRAQFDRVGVAYSGVGARVPTPAAHRARALLTLLRERARAPLDAWLDADASFTRALTHDLRLAFHVLGFVRLEQLATFAPAERLDAQGNFALPLRRSLDEDIEPATDERAQNTNNTGTVDAAGAVDDTGTDDDATPVPATVTATPDDNPRPRTPRRRVRGEDLKAACARARELLALLKDWPTHAPFAQHETRLRALLHEVLAWRDGETPGARDVYKQLGILRDEVGEHFELSAAEWPVLLERALAAVGAEKLGGAGGGVCVLASVEARARSFAHLFVIGLNRDSFPRVADEDPLLPEALRLRLEEMLPDIPLKKRSYDEERYLFAQLCASSPRVTLSFSSVSEDNKERPPSAFFERVRLAQNLEQAALAPEWLAARANAALPGDEALTLFGLAASSSSAARKKLSRAHGEFFELALSEVQHALAPSPAPLPAPAAWARGRLAVARELDARAPELDLGPYFGWLGARTLVGETPVTQLEAFARCPWQSFLRRELHLEALPDAGAALPALSPLLVGNLVHAVLEKIARHAGAPVNEALDLQAPGVAVAWPSARELAQWIRECAQLLLNEEGLHTPGFAQLLIEKTRAMFERVYKTGLAQQSRAAARGRCRSARRAAGGMRRWRAARHLSRRPRRPFARRRAAAHRLQNRQARTRQREAR